MRNIPVFSKEITGGDSTFLAPNAGSLIIKATIDPVDQQDLLGIKRVGEP